jgi:hypothetical protein
MQRESGPSGEEQLVKVACRHAGQSFVLSPGGQHSLLRLNEPSAHTATPLLGLGSKQHLAICESFISAAVHGSQKSALEIGPFPHGTPGIGPFLTCVLLPQPIPNAEATSNARSLGLADVDFFISSPLETAASAICVPRANLEGKRVA